MSEIRLPSYQGVFLVPSLSTDKLLDLAGPGEVKLTPKGVVLKGYAPGRSWMKWLFVLLGVPVIGLSVYWGFSRGSNFGPWPIMIWLAGGLTLLGKQTSWHREEYQEVALSYELLSVEVKAEEGVKLATHARGEVYFETPRALGLAHQLNVRVEASRALHPEAEKR